jgi:hypothetical protein
MTMSSLHRSISVRWIWLVSETIAWYALYIYAYNQSFLVSLVLLNGGQLVQVRTQQLGSIDVVVGIKLLIRRVGTIVTSSNR